jgi:hypothetical protein
MGTGRRRHLALSISQAEYVDVEDNTQSADSAPEAIKRRDEVRARPDPVTCSPREALLEKSR